MSKLLRLFLILSIISICFTDVSNASNIRKGIEAYQNGDYATALQEWLPLAKLGDADAQFSVGLIFDRGLNVNSDYYAAVKWFTLASKQGHIFAQSNLGWKYHKGQGVDKNNIHAFKWWTLAAMDGHLNAPYFLEEISKRMTQNDITLANSLARKCLESRFQDCL